MGTIFPWDYLPGGYPEGRGSVSVGSFGQFFRGEIFREPLS